jgi:hypothetical protein
MRQCVFDVLTPDDWYQPIVNRALTGLSETLQDEFLYRKAQKSYKKKSLKSEAEKIVNDLDTKGVSTGTISPHVIRKVWDDLENCREQLKAQRAKRPKGMASCLISLPKKGVYWKALALAIEEIGIIDAVNAYCKYPMDLDYCAMQLSHDDEEWYKDCFADVGLRTQKTVYMHCDQDFSLMKAIIYLEDVDKTKGPFSFIEGKNFLNGGYAQQRFLTQLDTLSIEQALSENKNNETVYYRPVFKNLKLRKEFLKLPIELQGTTHFGDDVLDGTPLSKYLLEKEVSLTSDHSNYALFTGGRTIHRGGTVFKGERWAFQIGFRQRDLSFGGRVKRIEQKAKLYAPQFVKDAVKIISSKRLGGTR